MVPRSVKYRDIRSGHRHAGRRRAARRLADAPLQAENQMNAVRLDQELAAPKPKRALDQQVGQARLQGWMHMQLRLFDSDNRRSGVQRGNHDGHDLRNADAHVVSP